MLIITYSVVDSIKSSDMFIFIAYKMYVHMCIIIMSVLSKWLISQ